MFRKTLILFIIFSCNAFASDKGIHILFDINSDEVDRSAVGTTDCYFQDGNLRVEVNMKRGSIDNVTMISNSDGKLFTLFPKDKQYSEIPAFMSSAAAQLIKENPGAFEPTKQKKKIAGYECTVFKKETSDSTDTVCVNQPLYDQYKDLFIKMKKMTMIQNPFADVEGFPLETILLGKKEKTKTVILVKKIDQQDFLHKFEIPKDYTEKNVIEGAADLLKKLLDDDDISPKNQ